MEHPRGWHSRGYLPHHDPGSEAVFITWRLVDSLPAEVVQSVLAQTSHLPKKESGPRVMRAFDAYLDNGHGSCILRQPGCASIVRDALEYDDGRRYQLHTWVVMPNHVHVLLTPLPGVALETIVRILKSVTATRINEIVGLEGRLCQPDYFDRTIRNVEHFERELHRLESGEGKALYGPARLSMEFRLQG